MLPSNRKASIGPKPGTLSHAAARLHCTLPTVYELIRAGKLRTYHLGRAHRVSDAAITDCIALLEQETAVARARQSQRADHAAILS